MGFEIGIFTFMDILRNCCNAAKPCLAYHTTLAICRCEVNITNSIPFIQLDTGPSWEDVRCSAWGGPGTVSWR